MLYYIFIFIGITMIVIVKLFVKDQSYHSTNELVEEVNQTVEDFSTELVEENQKIMDRIVRMSEITQDQNSRLTKRVEQLEIQLQKLDKNLQEPNQTPSKQLKDETFNEKENVLKINDRYNDLMKMHHDGKSVQYISNKTGINKGEVQLIINLAKQEGKSRAKA
ncbi:hypothetical protein [Chengkuizengella marina]|uniref:DUF2802 domain-containing protein n=1 Tax=Chengkuizengella marina TaxID=2507566 RepID=A0A6N9Q1E2_9BACL|nr:hypothetical protein [Chengkuizengella marina]NBI27388.1 DUF2802 domain-containing protein [Chengkuizengella marina]